MKVLLLLVVRDPVTRLISDYAQILENHRKRNLEYKSFEEAAFHGNSGAPNRNYDAIQKVRYVRKQVAKSIITTLPGLLYEPQFLHFPM